MHCCGNPGPTPLAATTVRISWSLKTIAASVTDPGDDPEVVLQNKTRADLLRHASARLSPEHREVIDLVYFHGKSVKEVAQIIGIATVTVKTRMFYARKKLAEFVAAA
jgi:RNA polymerase sigma-70 factor (ECF subfamily)